MSCYLKKFPAIGGNTVRTGGPMGAADPEWQNKFAALPEKKTLPLRIMLKMDDPRLMKSIWQTSAR